MQVIIYENLQTNTLTQQKIPSTFNEDKNSRYTMWSTIKNLSETFTIQGQRDETILITMDTTYTLAEASHEWIISWNKQIKQNITLM